jgi:hypothetical protein
MIVSLPQQLSAHLNYDHLLGGAAEIIAPASAQIKRWSNRTPDRANEGQHRRLPFRNSDKRIDAVS